MTTAQSMPSAGLRAARVLIPALAVASALPAVSAAVALVAGVAVALTLGNPWPAATRTLSKRLLVWSVVGLGAGMNLAVVFRVGMQGIGWTAVGIVGALLLGTFLGTRLGVSRDTSLLVTVGTSICGGSAIAAVAQVIRARDHDTSMALAVVFLLNAIALLIFPFLGHALNLGQHAFGMWCALAIHDTSSVVGAASQYGTDALEVATAAKLARALWIVPVSFAVAWYRSRGTTEESQSGAPRLPWFIAGFLLAAAIATYVPIASEPARLVATIARRLLVVTLFLIGLGLSRAALRTLGVRPLVQAVGLWLALGIGSLGGVLSGWIG